MDLVVEVAGAAPQSWRRECDALVAFMSFAVSRGFGSQHPLIALADLVHDVHHVSMGPLTTFYDATVEDAEDREKLELAWQPAGPLARALGGLARAMAGDASAQALLTRAGACTLPAEVDWLRELVGRLDVATPVRLSYTL